MKLRWTDQAKDDLKVIGRYIAQDNPPAARAWIEHLRRRARDAAQMPSMGRMVPELGREEIRELIVRNHRIVYRIRKRSIDVLTVFEGHRLLPLERADLGE